MGCASLSLVIVAFLLASFTARAKAALVCAGDCCGDGPVTIEELLGDIQGR